MFRIAVEVGQLDRPLILPTHSAQFKWAKDADTVEKLFLRVAGRWMNLANVVIELSKEEKQHLQTDNILKTMVTRTFLVRWAFWCKAANAVANDSPTSKPGYWNSNRSWEVTNNTLRRMVKSKTYHRLFVADRDLLPFSFVNRRGSHNEIIAHLLTCSAQRMSGRWERAPGQRGQPLAIDREVTPFEKFMYDGQVLITFSQLSERIESGAKHFWNNMSGEKLKKVFVWETNVPKPYRHCIYVRSDSLQSLQGKTGKTLANSFACCIGECGVLEGCQWDFEKYANMKATDMIKDPNIVIPCLVAWIDTAIKLEHEVGDMAPKIDKTTGKFITADLNVNLT